MSDVVVLENPISMKELILMTTDEEFYVNGNILIELDDVIGNGLEEFLDFISEKLVDNPCLMDVNYKVVGTLDGSIILNVSGDVSEIIKVEDELFEELKSALFMEGIEALEDFTDMDLSAFDDKDTIDGILDDIADQMPDEEMFKFIRKYLKKE